MSSVTTAPESREDALIRLADQARTTGVKLYMDRADGRFYASSRSQPGTFHRLSGFSCSCRGFLQHGRCAHLAALHSALGWLDPEPETPAPATVDDHGGMATSPVAVATVGVSRPNDQRGAGAEPAPLPFDQSRTGAHHHD